MSAYSDYWQEVLSNSAEENGISLSEEQVVAIARDIELAHDQYGMAFGHDCIPNPLMGENDRLRRALTIEQSLVHCEECAGTGRNVTYGPHHSADTQCWKCHGKGKRLP